MNTKNLVLIKKLKKKRLSYYDGYDNIYNIIIGLQEYFYFFSFHYYIWTYFVQFLIH